MKGRVGGGGLVGGGGAEVSEFSSPMNRKNNKTKILGRGGAGGGGLE